MSWSAEYTTFNEAEIRFVGDDSEESTAAMKVSVDAVAEILNSGVLGDPDKKRFSVRISGHSNPKGEPVPGYSNDYITINLFQMETD